MAQLKDLIVNGASRLIGDAFVNKIQITSISAPTSAGGSTYNTGTNGQVLKSNGTSIYWAADNNSQTITGVKGNSESSYRTGNVNITAANVGAVNKTGDTMTGNLGIQMGDTDKHIIFDYDGDGTAGASWRIAALGSGSSDTNYFTIQSGTSTTSATAWNNVIRLGQNTFDAGFGGNVYPLANNTKTLGTSSLKWSNVYATTFTGNLVGNADTATSATSATKATQDGNGNVISSTYLKLSGGTMTGGVTFVGNQTSAYNDKGIIFTKGSRIGENTNGGIGIYGVERVYIRPGCDGSSSGDGIEISTAGVTPSNNNSETLGDSSHKWSNVYATTFTGNLVGNADTATTATNLASAPSLATSGTTQITVTAGGKTSSAYTVPFATSSTNATNATNIYSSASTTKAYVLGTTTASSANHATVYNASVYTSGSVLFGAAWNDYAEYRITKDKIEAGRCVVETGHDDLILSSKRLQPGAEIVSDTFGFAIGETEDAKTPIATTGRALAYIFEGRAAAQAAIGRPVCSGPNGTVSIMTDEEYQKYGYCAIGTISAVPDYEEWGEDNIKVNGRVWIRI